MAKGFEIGVGVDTKAAKQAIESGLVEPLEDAQDELKKLGDSRGPGELERSLEDAQDATEKLETDTRDTAAAIEEHYRRAYREQKQSAEGAAKAGTEATGEFKREALANFSEVTSSFDGSMASITDLVQGTFGGLAAGIAGPVGLAAGGAAAAVGLIGAAIEGVGETSEAQKAVVIENFRQMAEEGLAAWESITAQNKRLTDAYADHEDEIKRISELTGLSFETVASAWAGNKDQLDLVNAAYEEMKANLRDTPFTSVEASNATIAGWDLVIGKLYEVNDGYSAASEKYARLAQQQSDNLIAAAQSAGTASQEVDELGNKLLTLGDGTQILIEADTGMATLNVDNFKGDLDGIPETVNTSVTLSEPDVSFVLKETQKKLDKGSLRVNLGVFTRDGKRVD